jgi:LCP family protein required for cell wall assembly
MIRRLFTQKKRCIITMIATALIMVIALVLSAYLLMLRYIHKMNLVAASELSSEQILQVNEIPELNTDEFEYEDQSEADPNIPDSPETTILSLDEEIRRNMEEGSQPIEYNNDVFNLLLIGTDTRISGDPGRSDAMILLSINRKTEKLVLTSLLRDIYLKIPGKNNNRLNAAYAYGGAGLLMETIEQNFKVSIDRFVCVDFFAFIDAVDAVGGVTIDVTAEEIAVINNYVNEINLLTEKSYDLDYLTFAGVQKLNGNQALGYARNRYVGNNDFERTARQRRVLEQIYHQVKGLSLSQLNHMLETLLPQVTTNLTEGELISLILSLPSYVNYEIEQWSIPMAESYTNERIRGMSVLGIDFEKNVSQLHEKVYHNIP